MSPKDELNAKAAELGRMSGANWSAFIQAFKQYADTQQSLCVNAPAGEVQVMQGRARQCLELLSLFENAVKSVDRLSRRQ